LGEAHILLFTGESNSGNTFTANYLANYLGQPLYCIDLSAVVSKYIGETEKNLLQVFEDADSHNAILLFDEADSLFGKRTEVSTTHDSYANLDSSYMLERIEVYPGLVILATNHREDVDDTLLHNVDWQVDLNSPVPPPRISLWRRILDWVRKL
jgi:SpoVK/Ycf46/Vps4 family AAA+-type ATPase